MQRWQKYCAGLATVAGLIPQALGQQPPGPTASPAELASADAVGTAAKIKKDESDATARRTAVRYLGTVNCDYWPEAEAALISSLRADHNESVRYEAAVALAGGCCCTKRSLAALALTVSASPEDGNPAEPSERVRKAAEAALSHCLERYKEVVPAPVFSQSSDPRMTESRVAQTSTPAARPNPYLNAYYNRVEGMPFPEVVGSAHAILAERTRAANAAKAAANRNLPQLLRFPMAFSFRSKPQSPTTDGRRVNSETAVTAVSSPASTATPPYPRFMNESKTGAAEQFGAGPAPVSQVAGASEPRFPDSRAIDARPARAGQPTEDLRPVVAEAKQPKATPVVQPAGLREGGATAEGPAAVLEHPDAPKPDTAPAPLANSVATGASPLSRPTPDGEGGARLTEPTPAVRKSAGASASPSPAYPARAGENPVFSGSYARVMDTGWSPVPRSQPMFDVRKHATPGAAPAHGSPYNPLPETMPAVRPAVHLPEVTATPAGSDEVPRPPAGNQRDANGESPSSYNSLRHGAGEAPNGRPSVAGLLIILQDAPEPSQRVWAAEMLAASDWSGHDDVIPGLLTTAVQDPAPTVRVLCIRCLATRNVRMPAVLRALRDLQTDVDARVQHEAVEALNKLAGEATGIPGAVSP